MAPELDRGAEARTRALAAGARARELFERLVRIQSGEGSSLEDVEAARRAVLESVQNDVAAHERAADAHRRAAEAHRSAAVVARRGGHDQRAEEHQAAARADDESAEADDEAARLADNDPFGPPPQGSSA